MGVHDGSILSVTLNSIKINACSFAEVLRGDMQGSLYIDDYIICYKSKIMNSIERKLKLCLHKIKKNEPMRMASIFKS